jgi:hypothetical protein
MRKVSDKSCRENQKHFFFVCSITFNSTVLKGKWFSQKVLNLQSRLVSICTARFDAKIYIEKKLHKWIFG